MAKTRTEKQRIKRKAKQQKRRQKATASFHREKADFFFFEAMWHKDTGRWDKALSCLEKASRLDPKNDECFQEMIRLAYKTNRPDFEIKALLGLYNNNRVGFDQIELLCNLLIGEGRYQQALGIIEETLPRLAGTRGRTKKLCLDSLLGCQRRCQHLLQAKKRALADAGPEDKHPLSTKPLRPAENKMKRVAGAEPCPEKKPLPEIPVTFQVNPLPLEQAIGDGQFSFSSVGEYELTLFGYGIRLKESFESLICLGSLSDVRSFWYQEETAKKVLKVFRGRALLTDEVGLGKTIEALIVLKEYIQRGMVRNALILTPTPLVSQWKEELWTKFALNFPSTDDQAYRTGDRSFWKEPFVLSSINLAKSKKNFSAVTEREYDMVIVDEAHHLKNRNTLNWKLVNALKKRFLLLLTATPVENNLMELYNLVTLLKPGQLKTASEFRKEFMTRGDPTDPRNRNQLKELLGQVMIRNTRAVAKIDIPPRFAHTIKVEPSELELDLYERISTLIREMNATNGGGQRFLLKTLLEEAGSSPRAVGLTLSHLLQRQDMPLRHEKEIRGICNMCRSLDESNKNKMLLNLIKASPGSDKKLVFVKYLGTLEQISEFLEWNGISCALFHGQMDNRKKDEQIQAFREEKDILVTTEIGGEGRNLQFCHQMVNYDLPWNPMKIEQRIGRIHRIGQEKEVAIYNLCAAGSVEDYILEILDKKINMFEMVIGEMDMVLGRIMKDQDFSEMVFDIWINSRSGEEREEGFSQLGSRLRHAKTSYHKTKQLDEKLFGENYEL